MSQGFPSVWAIMTARVFGVSASSRRETSMLYVRSWMSSSTGTQRSCTIGERGREPGGDRDHFRSGADPPLAEQPGRQRGERQEIRTRAAVAQRGVAHAHEPGQLELHVLGEASLGPPAVEAGFQESLQL